MKYTTRHLLLAAIGCMAFRNAEPGTDGAGTVPADTKTPEQLAAEKAAADQAAAEKKAADKAAKDAEKAKAAAEKAAKKEQEKAAKAAEVEAAKAKKAAEKAAAAAKAEEDKKAKEAAAAAKKEEQAKAKEANKLPVQNGVTRPKDNTVTGSVWVAADAISFKKGSPAAVSEVLAALPGVADATVKTQYARWRKFFGVQGRVAPVAATPAPAAEGAAAAPAEQSAVVQPA